MKQRQTRRVKPTCKNKTKEKITQQGNPTRYGPTTYRFCRGIGPAAQEAVVHVSPLPAQPPRPASSQSNTGPTTGERPCSRALSVAGMDEGQPQSMPPLVDCHRQSRISTNIVSSSARVDTSQLSFQTLSQNSSSHLSQLSAPLFTENRYSTSTDNDQENCNAEVTKIMRWQIPSQVTTIVMPPKRPVSTPSTVDYSTQGDPNQIAPQGNHEYSQNNSTTAIQNTNNYLIPDGSDRCIRDLQEKILHISILENGHNAYLVELPDLKSLLRTSRYLMGEITGHFYAVYGNNYQHMCTIPRLLHT